MHQDFASNESGADAARPGQQSTERTGQFSQTTDQIDYQARNATDRIQEVGRREVEAQKETAADAAEVLADAVDRASDELHRQNHDGLANYASQVAGVIGELAEKLRNRSVDELLTETRGLAQRSPTAFFLGSVGAGFALSRFLKASTHRDARRRSEVGQEPSSDTQSADPYADKSQTDHGLDRNEARAPYPDIPGASGWLPSEWDDTSRPNTH